MSETCARWIALCDRQALGEPLSAQEQSFLSAHAASCPACGAEGAVWRDMALLIDAPPDGGNATAPAAARPRRIWAFAAVAAAACLALVLRERAPRQESPAATIRVSLISGGEIEVDGRPAQSGASVALGSLLFARSGTACLLVDQGIRACVAPGGLLRVAELSETSRRLELRAGKVAASLEPQRAGRSFGVVTRDGSAIAVGTAFSVEVPPDGPVVTRVVHGTVLVRSTGGAEQRVGAHQQAAMRGPVQPLAAGEEERERPLLQQADRAPSGSCDLRVESTPAGAEVSIDGRAVGITPLGLSLDPGEHALVVTGAQGRSWREQVRVAAGEQLLRSFAEPAPDARDDPELEAPAHTTQALEAHASTHDNDDSLTTMRSAARRAPDNATHDSPATAQGARRTRAPARRSAAPAGAASALLSTAREQRAHGDVEAALRAYRALFERHPASDEALAARVAYGEMLLAAGGDPGAALASFEQYLARGGPLLREASFGRVRALRALGKHEAERAALDDFLRSFPDGPLADAVRARQRALQQP